MSTQWVRRGLHWTSRVLLALGLLLVLAAAGLWWWAGQEGSLEWVLQRAARGQPLQAEGVQGSVRHGWRIQRMVWEKDGLKIEARDITLEWQPLALLSRTLRVDEVGVGSVRVTDTRAKDDEPLQPPDSLRLPFRITVDELVAGTIVYDGTADVEAGGLAGSYAFDGLRHRVKIDSLKLADGDYKGEGTVLAVQPMTLQVKLAGRVQAPVPGVQDPVALVFEAGADGTVRDFQARAQLRVPQAGIASADLPQATATARITPFETMPVPQGAAEFRQLDVGQFWPAAPHTALSGRVAVTPRGTATWVLSADVRNAIPGPWDARKLPLASAKAEGEWRSGTALVRSLQAQLGGGSVEGQGAWEGGGWNFSGQVDDVDPSQLHGAMAPLPLSGPVKARGEGGAVDFDVALAAGAARRPPPARKPDPDGQAAWLAALELREVTAKGRYAGDALTLEPVRIRTSDALLEGQVALQLETMAASGKLQLRAPGIQGQASGSIAETRGQGTLELAARDLAQAQQWLRRFPGVGAMLAGVQLRGNADARLAWQGGWRDPAVQGRIAAAGVQWTPAATGAGQPPPWVLRRGEVKLAGRLRDAALDVQAEVERGQRRMELAVAGRAGGTLGANPAWRGRIASLELRAQDPALAPGPWQLQLRNPVEWRLAGANFEVSAGEAVLRAPALRGGAAATDAVLTWSPVRRQGGQLTTAGRLSGLPMAWLELVGGPQAAGSALTGDMVFDAQWNAQLGSTVRVDASLVRVRGDVNVLAESADGAAARVTAGVREARVAISSQGEQLTLSLLWDSERAGRAEGQVRTRLARTADGGWEWPEAAPLDGRIQAQLPRIGVWSLLAPPGWRLRGSLAADITVAGNRTQPLLTGPIRADDLALRSVVDGIELKNGRLRAELAGRRLVVSEFVLGGSEEGGGAGGTITARGEGQITPQGLLLVADAQLNQLRASIRSDRQLTLSGPVQARMGPEGTTVNGKLVVDRARIQIPEETAPRLGDDVLVRNAPGLPTTEAERKAKPAATPTSTRAARTVTLAVSIDLGNDFRVSGRGVDTRLAGSVDVAGKSLTQPQLTGIVRTVGGTYNGYGQRMTIERGELRFLGPADNPALDVLAIRPNTDVRVGVLITGRAQAPHIELYSEAGLSQAETLSWLVLGRSSAGGGAEAALLQRAAAALIADKRGNGKGIAGNLGLDDVSVRNSDGGPTVRLGKRFAENFYAAYERSISGAMGTLYIFYDVSRRLTVRAEAGERTGIDLIFTFAFDRGRERDRK
ncbi:MAG: translocation/assembly module TamB domain-containing protein [Ramlibacter sp.]